MTHIKVVDERSQLDRMEQMLRQMQTDIFSLEEKLDSLLSSELHISLERHEAGQ